MIKSLDIKGVSQTKGSFECGIAATKMVGDYYGMRLDYEKLKEELPIKAEWGLYIHEIGTYFLKHGFKAEIVSQNTRFLKLKHRDASTREIRDHIGKLQIEAATEDGSYLKDLSEGFDKIAEFIDAGGKFTARRPTAHVIEQELYRKRPVIAVMTTAFMFDTKHVSHNEHCTVINGFDRNRFSFVDPSSRFEGTTQQADKNDFMYGIYANTYPSVEGGSILKLKL